ncbi:MAG: hypothetical protein R3B57_02550 [Phycisphaerales bacterium]
MPVTLAPRRAEPLSSEQWGRAERLAARLRGELGSIVAALPEHARGASGMARHIGVVRNTCQRVVSVLAEPAADAGTLARLPGVKGLEQFLEGCAGVGVDRDLLALGEAAVRDFDRFIRENAGSQSKLADRIAAAEAPVDARGLASIEARMDLFHSAVNVTGRACEVAISLEAYRPAPGLSDKIERAVVNGLIQTSVTPGGIPASILAGDTLDPEAEPQPAPVSLDRQPARGVTPSAILAEFSTTPLPTVTTRGPGSQLVQVVDPERLEPGQTFDVVTARRFVHPKHNPDGSLALDAVWSLVNCPSQRLIFDVYFHRDMERQFRPAVDAQMWYPNLESPVGDRWLTRFPAQPKLQLLGMGLSAAESPFYARHAQLTAHVFERLGWDASELVGFRCEVEYPIWRAGYCMTLEYASPDPSHNT